MYQNQGFTLIELLVVVLIIGILASVALPQYQKAVAKARVAKMLPWFKKIKEGRELYVMSTGNTMCMDLSRYLDAYGVSAYRFRCSGASADGPCENGSAWCDGALWVDDKNVIGQGTGHATWYYTKKPGAAGDYADFVLTLVTYQRGYTSDEKTGDLFCSPRTDWGRSMCKSLASSPEQVKCFSTKKECYRMAL